VLDFARMSLHGIAILLLLGGVPPVAQAQASAPPAAPTRTYTNEIGFSYTFPADWDVVDMASTLPEAQQQAQQQASSDQEKRGIGCTQMGLSARFGNPTSTVVAVVLPFACLGSEMTEKDLSGMGEGALEGVRQSFDFGEPVYGAYSLGSHSMWIERVRGSLKDHPETQYAVETVCSILKKGAVCWMAMAADDSALLSFERGVVVLDDEAPAALVPANAFANKPSN
jgi:hypothetical protein